MVLLRVVPHEGATFDYVPQAGTIVVGRSSDCDLVIADPYLSRHHARLTRDGDQVWCIEDLGSHNGTRVNDQRVYAAQRLTPGDVVKMSATSLQVLDGPVDGEGMEEPPTRDDTAERESVSAQESRLKDGARFRSAREMLAEVPTPPKPDALDERLQRWSERLGVVNELHKTLANCLDLYELMEGLLDCVFDHLEPERGIVYLSRRGGGFYVAAHRATDPGSEPLDSTHLVAEVAEKGLAALVLDVRSDERFSQAESLRALGIRSLVAAPLLEGDESKGMIALDSSLGRREYQEEDMELLVAVAAVAAVRIVNLELIEDAVERNRLESELALARRIQVALLPQEMPEIPGWTIQGGNLPSRGVSGDMYEVVERLGDRGRRELVLLLADVSGKGMAASLLTASLEALLAPLIEQREDPVEICRRASRLLYHRTPPEQYATAILAALEPWTGELRMVNAGHNPGLRIRADGAVELLEATGCPLGLMPETDFASRTVHLEPGDTLFLYTDGLVEACGPDGREYGLDRLVAACRRGCSAEPGELMQAVERDLEDFVCGTPFTDDRTHLVVRRLP